MLRLNKIQKLKKKLKNYYIYNKMFVFLTIKSELTGFLQKDYNKLRQVLKVSVNFTP